MSTQLLTGTLGEYEGFPLKVFTLEDLLGQDGDLCYYVWPYEGRFADGQWHFYKGEVLDGSTLVPAPDKPLLVDGLSARAFKLIYEAVNETNKAKLREYVESRGLFCWAMDKLIWPHVRFGG